MLPNNNPGDVADTVTLRALVRAAHQARERLGREPSPRDIAVELAPEEGQIDHYTAALEQWMQQLAGAMRRLSDPLRSIQSSLGGASDAMGQVAKTFAAGYAHVTRCAEQLRAALRIRYLGEIAAHDKTSLPHMLAIHYAREASIEVPRWASERILDCAATAAQNMIAHETNKKRQTDTDILTKALGFSGRRGRGRAVNATRRLVRDLSLALAVYDRMFPLEGGRGDKRYIACQLVADDAKVPVSAVTRAYKRLEEKLRTELQDS